MLAVGCGGMSVTRLLLVVTTTTTTTTTIINMGPAFLILSHLLYSHLHRLFKLLPNLLKHPTMLLLGSCRC